MVKWLCFHFFCSCITPIWHTVREINGSYIFTIFTDHIPNNSCLNGLFNNVWMTKIIPPWQTTVKFWQFWATFSASSISSFANCMPSVYVGYPWCHLVMAFKMCYRLLSLGAWMSNYIFTDFHSPKVVACLRNYIPQITIVCNNLFRC